MEARGLRVKGEIHGHIESLEAKLTSAHEANVKLRRHNDELASVVQALVQRWTQSRKSPAASRLTHCIRGECSVAPGSDMQAKIEGLEKSVDDLTKDRDS